jgi:hypothetical protein
LNGDNGANTAGNKTQKLRGEKKNTNKNKQKTRTIMLSCFIVNRIVLKTLPFSYTTVAVPLSFVNKLDLVSSTIVVIIYVHVLSVIYK